MQEFTINKWRFIPKANSIIRADTSVRIERRASEVLTALIERHGEIVSKEELTELVWNGAAVSEHSVAVVMSDLRRALKDDWRNPSFIETIPKRGYRLIADLQSVQAGPIGDREIVLVKDTNAIDKGARVNLAAPIAVTTTLIVAIGLLTRLGSPASAPETLHSVPIVIEEFCTSESEPALADKAYGLNRMIGSSLSEGLDARLKRSNEAREANGSRELGRNHMILGGAVIATQTGPVLTVELTHSQSEEVRWAAKYDLGDYQDVELAEKVALDLAQAIKSS